MKKTQRLLALLLVSGMIGFGIPSMATDASAMDEPGVAMEQPADHMPAEPDGESDAGNEEAPTVLSTDAPAAPASDPTDKPEDSAPGDATETTTDESGSAGSPADAPSEPTEAPAAAEPEATPTIEPTEVAASEPAATPTAEPTPVPTAEQTATPTKEPSTEPTAEPTAAPTAEPTAEPTPIPEPTMPVVEDVPLPSEATQQVQAMLKALPTADELAAMDADARAAAYAQVSAAYEAYEMLTETEKTQISGAERFASLFEILNSAVDTLEEETAAPSYTVTIPTSISLNKDNGMNITVSDCANLDGKRIQVKMSSSNGYQLKCGEQAISYTVQCNGQIVTNGSTFSFGGNGSETFDMTVGNTSGKPAGEYQDTLTFTVGVSAGE